MSHHTRGYTIHWAWAYDASLQVLSMGRERTFRRNTLALASLGPGLRLLDVGCGTGSLAIAAKRGEPTLEVHGIDPAEEMIARARAKATAGGVQVRFEPGIIEDLPFEDGSFDRVTSSIMLHHLPAETLRAGMAEVHRVLTPGGRLVVVDFVGGGPLLHRLASILHGEGGQPPRNAELVLEAVTAQGFAEPTLHPMKPSYLYGLVAQRAG